MGYCHHGRNPRCWPCQHEKIHLSKDVMVHTLKRGDDRAQIRKEKKKKPTKKVLKIHDLGEDILALIRHTTRQGWIDDAINFMEALDPTGKRGINYLRDPSTGARWPHLDIRGWKSDATGASAHGQPILGKNIAQFTMLHPNAIPPKKAHQEDVGYDLSSLYDTTMGPESTKLIRTGIAMQPPKGTYIQLTSRSGLALEGLSTEGGTIDPGYTGEIKVILRNGSGEWIRINKGDKITQAVFLEYKTPQLQEVPKLTQGTRQTKGFGSSDKKEVHLLQVSRFKANAPQQVFCQPVKLHKNLILEPGEQTTIEIFAPPDPRNLFFEPNEEIRNLHIEGYTFPDKMNPVHSRATNTSWDNIILPKGTIIGHLVPYLNRTHREVYELNLQGNGKRSQKKGKAPLRPRRK